MLQISNLSELSEQDIPKLLELVQPILKKRAKLHEKYSRKANDAKVMFSDDNSTTVLPFEKYFVDLATGYTAGKPIYNVNSSENDKTKKLYNKLFDKPMTDDEYVEAMDVVIKHISSYNDDRQENHDLIHDIFELTSCYEIIYESEENEIVYSHYSPLQTVATWDYSIPANLTGIVRTWTETDVNGKEIEKVELTDKNAIRIYSVNGDVTTLDYENNHFWGDVPAIVVETEYAIFEPCEDVVSAYEQLVQNTRNTYQYNDSDCKLKISGYEPENDLTIVNNDGVIISNPARIAEDELILNSRTMYVGEGGNVEWLTKPVDANGFTTILKTYSDIMFQLSGIPNTSDMAFSGSGLNASAIDRKFYSMDMQTSTAISLLQKAYLRRWELIFNRINVKKNTQFDFRDIVVEIPRNLPSMEDEQINQMLKLKGTISEKTLVTALGYDFDVEKKRIDDETTENIIRNIEDMRLQTESGVDMSALNGNSAVNHYDTSKKGVEREQVEENGSNTQSVSTEN